MFRLQLEFPIKSCWQNNKFLLKFRTDIVNQVYYIASVADWRRKTLSKIKPGIKKSFINQEKDNQVA